MKKRWIIFAMVLCFMCINVEAKSKTIYLKECTYTDEYKRWLKLSDKEKKDIPMPTMCVSDGKNYFHLVGGNTSGASVNDSRFDLRDHGYVTSVKNQNATGSCWAFATNASIESNLLVNGKGTYDLSEAHLELSTQTTHNYNRLTFNRTIDTGGNAYLSSAYLRNNWGSVLESTLPFNELEQSYANKTQIAESKVLNNAAMLDVNSISMFGNSGVCTADTINDIKEYLITNGALTATLYVGNVSGSSMYFYYDGESYEDLDGNTVTADQLSNHAVTIVGWDDNVSKDEFTLTNKPSRNGAFIIKNSYGEKNAIMGLEEYKTGIYNRYEEAFNNQGIYSPDQISDESVVSVISNALNVERTQVKIENGTIYVYTGDSGYQYVSYDDIHICGNLVGFFDIDTEVETHVYGYDDLGVSGTVSVTGTDKVYLATIFEKESTNTELLKEISIYFENAGQDYKIYFANGVTKSTSLATLIASGTSDFTGYHTVKVNNIEITSDKYSIIVVIEDSEDLSLGIAMKGYGAFTSVPFTEGVQFLSADGITYSDTAVNSTPFHLLVKAYTNDDTTNEEIKPDDGNENDDDTSNEEVKPDDGNENDDDTSNEEVKPDDGNENDDNNPNEEIDPDDDKTNEDGDIEFIPNDMNNPINDPSEPDETNPSTGDSITYIVFIAIGILSVGSISYLKFRKNN